MRGQLRIDSLFAFIVLDEDGTEGIPAFLNGNVVTPMTGADEARVESLRPIAVQWSHYHHKPIKLVRFTHRVEVETIGGGEPS